MDFQREAPVISIVVTHAVLASLAIIILLPLGAASLAPSDTKKPIPPSYLQFHIVVQCSAYILFTVATGLGIRMATRLDFLTQPHAIIGMLVFAALTLQLVEGLCVYLGYRKHGRSARSTMSHVHRWAGRVVVLLGIVNGGLGLRLANNTLAGKVVYGIIAGVVGAVWVFLFLVTEFAAWAYGDM